MYVCILNNNNTVWPSPLLRLRLSPFASTTAPFQHCIKFPTSSSSCSFPPISSLIFFFNFCLFHKVNVLGVFAAASLFAIAPEWGREMGWFVSVGWKRDGLCWGRLYGCVVQYLCVLGAGQDCGTCDALVACCLSLLICSYWFFFFFTSIICRDYTQHYT